MNARATVFLGVVVAGAVAACGSSPNATFYALSPTAGAAQPGAPRVIELRTPTIAGYLDRPEIVRRVVDHRLDVAANDRWGEPLDAMIGRVLAEDIERRAPGSSVFTEGGSVEADADATVEINVRRFEVGSDGAVDLTAEVAVERGEGKGTPAVQAIALRGTPNGGTDAALAGTMSDLLGRLADQVAAMLRGGGASMASKAAAP